MAYVSYHLDTQRTDKLNRITDMIKGGSLFKDCGSQCWINFKGKFSLEMFYKRMYIWLTENGYSDVDGYKDRFERYFFEKRNPDGSIGELWFWWRTKKDPDGNKLFEYRIDIDVQILVMGKDEIVVEGNKFSVNNGEISIFIKPYLSFSHKIKKEWTEDSLLKPFLKWFDKKGFVHQIDDKKAEFYTDFNRFYATIKQFLGLENYMIDRKTEFHPVKGVPQYKL